MSSYDKARSWLDKQPPAVSGANGHNQTFEVACRLLNGFALPKAEADALMREYSSRCQPPWTDSEISHKLQDASKVAHQLPRGHMLQFTKSVKSVRSVPFASQPAKEPTPVFLPQFNGHDPVFLPQILPDPTRSFLEAVFRKGEKIRISDSTLNEKNGKEIPSEGLVLTREQWIEKLGKKGDGNSFWQAKKDRTGLFASVNPMTGATDDTVTDFRHALLESDKMSLAEQWSMIEQSRIPVACVIHSGGKSIHAWVRIDAADRAEYDRRVEYLHSYFASLDVDPKNKNPSRYSRLPGCIRFQKRQELLALRMGADSWEDWVQEVEDRDLGESYTPKDLLSFDTSNDPDCILGFVGGKTTRFLCRKGTAWLIAPSGVGKSSLSSQAAAMWAIGRDLFGIRGGRPLRSIIVQAENDKGDLAEMIQGIESNLVMSVDEEALFEKNMIWHTEKTSTKEKFVARLVRIINKYKRTGPVDLVWLDPFMSFSGIDISKQDQCSWFLREILNPVIDATGICLIGVHHTGKPPRRTKGETDGWTAWDYVYAMIGSSELANWARAVIVLRSINDITFEMKIPKRGRRAGAQHPDGQPTVSIWLQHSKNGIFWQQIQPPEEPMAQEKSRKPKSEGSGKNGRPSQLDKVLALNMHEFCSAFPPEGEHQAAAAKRLNNWLAGKSIDVGTDRTAIRYLAEIVGTGKVKKADDKYFKGENA